MESNSSPVSQPEKAANTSDMITDNSTVSKHNELGKVDRLIECTRKPSTRAYEDKPQESDAKVLATSWPDLIGKTRQEAEEFIKAKGYSNIKILRKGTSSSTEHDESRVILLVDENDIIVEEPKVG